MFESLENLGKSEMDLYKEKIAELDKQIAEMPHKPGESAPIRDGIINPERYYAADTKILFVLREPYSPTPDTGGWSVTESLGNKSSLKEQAKDGMATFKPMVITSNMIEKGIPFGEAKSISTTEEAFDTFKGNTGYINVCKNLNLESRGSNKAFIAQKAIENKELLDKQVEIYQPDVVILGGTSDYLVDKTPHGYSILGNDIPEGNVIKYDGHCTAYYNEDRLFIAVYHPSSTAYPRMPEQKYCEQITNAVNEWRSIQSEISQRAKFSPAELAYVDEIVPEHNIDLLIARIDELNQCEPPKAIDSDPKMANLIEPMIDEIDITYLEAPQDNLQIESIAGQMTDMEGLDFSEWKELSLQGRMDVLEQVEERVADIVHRPACELEVKELGAGHLGYYSNGENKITLNESYVQSNSIADYREVLDTLIHEGRHAYQDYNLHVREVHPRQGDITNWKLNEFGHGYQDVKHCGFQAYEMQPLESDARAFAEDVLATYQNKLA